MTLADALQSLGPPPEDAAARAHWDAACVLVYAKLDELRHRSTFDEEVAENAWTRVLANLTRRRPVLRIATDAAAARYLMNALRNASIDLVRPRRRPEPPPPPRTSGPDPEVLLAVLPDHRDALVALWAGPELETARHRLLSATQLGTALDEMQALALNRTDGVALLGEAASLSAWNTRRRRYERAAHALFLLVPRYCVARGWLPDATGVAIRRASDLGALAAQFPDGTPAAARALCMGVALLVTGYRRKFHVATT